ncbi:alkaline phosphatase family protein [Sulfobacillus acidophilus]|uniref:Alkaline phosphatase family protein n=1 Tax=Sulfobacillus acidophilus TaxID=53633 RepID=A0ABS3AVF0_9FIRM|nr:alkaline phosphatase family protein [Sulfobacillus acidophilus]
MWFGKKIAIFIVVLSCSFLVYGQVKVNHVIIVSIDGLRPDALGKGYSPTMDKMQNAGFVAANAYTIDPSITLPSHTSMLTGRIPEVHKVLWNSYKPEKGVVKHETCLELAKQNGLKTAFIINKKKLKHLLRPKSFNYYSLPGIHAKKVARSFAKYVDKKGLPNLTFLHFADPDRRGHVFGWMSTKYLHGVRNADLALKMVVKTITGAKKENDTVIILTADHGGFGKSHGEDIIENKQIPWIVVGDGVEKAITYENIYTYDTAATALDLLGLNVPPEWEGRVIEVSKD